MNNSFSRTQLVVTGVSVILVVAVALVISSNLKKHPNYNFATAKTENMTQGVTETGDVKAAQDLSLSFQKSGTITATPVKVGDEVKKGQVLITLDNKNASAAVSQANGALEAAQANFEKVVNGATSADVNVAQTTLDNAKKNLDATTKQQDLLVANAQSSYLNTVNPTGMSNGLTAIPATSNLGNAVITITGSYHDTVQGQYALTAYTTGSGMKFTVTGLESGSVDIKTAPVALGTKGLFIQVTGSVQPGDTWTISIPNTQSASYVSDFNAYNAAVAAQTQAVLAAQNAVNAAQAALSLKQTAARPEDITAAQAQVSTAQAALELAQNNYSDGSIISPIDAVVTAVNNKIGETVSPGKPVISLISKEKFQIETYISEGDLGKVKPGDTAQVTLDAYGDTPFAATVLSIDPAASVQNNVSSYKATLQFNQDDSRIKEGLAANITIYDDTKQGALAVPTQDIITKGDKKFVNKKIGDNQVEQVSVETGIEGLDGMTEITKGLAAGDQIVDLGN